MEKTISPAYQISGKRRKLVGYIGELRDGEMLIHSMEYSTYSQAEQALDALAFDLMIDAPAEAPAFDPSTCCFCHGLHHPQRCPEMRALLFAPDTCEECAGAGIIASNGCGDQCGGWAETCPDCDGRGMSAPVIRQRDLIYPPLDVEFAPVGPEV